MRYRLVQGERGVLSVERACRLLKVSASGYYAWQQRQTYPQRVSDERALLAQISTVFEESRRT